VCLVLHEEQWARNEGDQRDRTVWHLREDQRRGNEGIYYGEDLGYFLGPLLISENIIKLWYIKYHEE
jgi:hypothetical protein